MRDVANRLLCILLFKSLLSRALSIDAFMLLLVPTSYVSLPQVQMRSPPVPELYARGPLISPRSSDIPAHWPRRDRRRLDCENLLRERSEA